MKSHAIILAAGKGTRMKSKHAKVLFPLAGKSLVERVVQTALSSDCEQICVVVGHQKQAVRDALKCYPRLRFADQDEQLGTGHAVMMAANEFADLEGLVYILCGDVPLLKASTLRELKKAHTEAGATATVLTMMPDDPGKYGRIIRDEKGDVLRITEFKDATEAERAIGEVNSGIYCFDAPALFAALKQLTNDNAQHEYYLTDTLEILNREGKKVISVVLKDMNEAAGINSRKQLAELEDVFYANVRNAWMEDGVSIECPATVLIGEDVQLAADVTIGTGCVLRGTTSVGEGTIIGPHCILENARIGNCSRLRGLNAVYNTDLPAGMMLKTGEQRGDC
jgi:bifunctional UDP-N-acetylglucosamine pyrophosphorylase/glucosamine-1-phosphate N-acetyltransferase